MEAVAACNWSVYCVMGVCFVSLRLVVAPTPSPQHALPYMTSVVQNYKMHPWSATSSPQAELKLQELQQKQESQRVAQQQVQQVLDRTATATGEPDSLLALHQLHTVWFPLKDVVIPSILRDITFLTLASCSLKYFTPSADPTQS